MKKDTKQPNAEAMRHSCAHLMAAAVQRLWPEVKFGIGPVIENGFYYDFDMAYRLTDKDLPKIEEKMLELQKEGLVFEQFNKSLDSALNDAKKDKQPYKQELIELIQQTGDTQTVSFYRLGKFVDLCRGPHLHATRDIGPFKLLSVAGAYWRGSEKNPMLQRIYGACFSTQKDLDHFVWQQEEAKKRDHKKIGKALDLFIFIPIVGPGLPIFTARGTVIRQVMEDYLVKIKKKYGLVFVWTPHMARSELYKKSKHWQKYEAMMPPMNIEDDEYVLKPMNCPHHFQIYLSRPRSYRELPLRLAENTTVYRYEKSGELNGLLRVRAVTQDDSHWFVPHDLLDQEIGRALTLSEVIFKDFCLGQYTARVSVRDPNTPDKYIGKSSVWDGAEKELIESVKRKRIQYEIGVGEAAFYGPKIDLLFKDSLGRQWQLSTIQLDFNQPENFDLTYTDSDGSLKRPAILHIAILGSIERFLAILLEHYAGALPVWLCPVQALVIPIADRHVPYARSVYDQLVSANVRSELDARSQTMQAKVRDAQLQKVPFMLIIGDAEQEKKTLSVRLRSGENRGEQPVGRVLLEITRESKEHGTVSQEPIV